MKLPQNIGLGTLVLSTVSGLAYVSVPVLESAGFFVEARYLFTCLVVRLLFYAIALFAFVVCIRAGFRGHRFDYSYVALAVVIVALVLVRSGVMQRRVEAWNFSTRLPRRMIVLDLVSAGNLKPRSAGPCDCFYADLPPEYADLSAGGEVLVSRHSGGFSVTFFVGRSPLFSEDDYSAFIFRSDEGQPQTGEEDTYSFYQIRAIQQHWFFVRHT